MQHEALKLRDKSPLHADAIPFIMMLWFFICSGTLRVKRSFHLRTRVFATEITRKGRPRLPYFSILPPNSRTLSKSSKVKLHIVFGGRKPGRWGNRGCPRQEIPGLQNTNVVRWWSNEQFIWPDGHHCVEISSSSMENLQQTTVLSEYRSVRVCAV